jgi:hypothetical protein
MSTPYYVPSGRLPLRAVGLTIVCALLTIGPAWVYAWLTVHIPLLIFHGLALVGFAVGMGAVAYSVARRGKARNPLWMGRLGMLIGLVGWYVQCAATLAILIPKNWLAGSARAWPDSYFVGLLGNPQEIFELAGAVSEAGLYRIVGVTPGSGVLIGLWIAEFLFMVTVPRLFARHATKAPFCEKTNTWADGWVAPRRFAPVASPAEMVDRLERHPEHVLSLLDAPSEEAPAQYAELTLYRCSDDAFLTITNVAHQGSGKKARKDKQNVVEYLRLSGINIDRFILDCMTPHIQAGAPQIVPDPPELIAVIDHLTCGRFEEALAGAVVHTTAAHDSLRIDALRLCALATARLECWDASLSYWTTLFDEDGSALNALQVATSSAMAGDVDNGKIWIARARERNAVSREMPDLQITTNFITALVQSGHMAQALPHLDEVRAVYIGLGITDPTFLFARHVPSFSTFLDNSLPIVKNVLGQKEGRAWYASMLPHLDAPGKKTLMSWLDQHIATMPSPTPAAI